MSIKGFKKVEDHKGYKLDSKDRQIFERELKESLFGTSATTWDVAGNTDMIEFVLYDTNDNQLPQGDAGRMVRYISLDDTNIRKYFVISEDIEDIKANGAKEFLVDTEILIKEAGYSNGIFKTQITLINRRAGSEIIEHDKLWIHEISPSRTEIRVLPVKMSNDKVLKDLEDRYKVYTDDGQFRDDTISFVQEYVENVNVEDVFNSLLKIKGHVSDGQTYVNLIKKEFKINDFGKFILDIKTLFVKAMQYWVENKDSNVKSGLFGHPLDSSPSVDLSVSQIEQKVVHTLTDIIDKLLNKRDVLERSVLSEEEQVTYDKVKQILNQTISDSEYESTLPPSMTAEVRGCTDPNAENFNPSATLDDGSCIYPLPPIEIDEPNYAPLDVADVTVTTQFYVWSAVGTIYYTLPGKGYRTRTQTWNGVEYDMIELTYIGTPRFEGDIRTYVKPKTNVVRCMDSRANNFGEEGICRYDIVNPLGNPSYVIDDDIITRYPTRTTQFDVTGNLTGTNEITPIQESTRYILDYDTSDAYYTSTRTTPTSTPISKIIKSYL